MSERETSAAIAERVVDEWAKRYPSCDQWTEWPTHSRERFIALVDAGLAAASSEPRTIPPLTQAEVDREMIGPGTYQDAFRHFYALAASRLGATVAAPGTTSEKRAEFLTSPDLDAIKREAAREALTRLQSRMTHGQTGVPPNVPWNYAEVEAFRDREYPAPVPEPPHVTVNGWRVTWDGERYWAVAQPGSNCRVGESHDFLNAAGVCQYISVPVEADADVVRVLALREGRGDGHADAK